VPGARNICTWEAEQHHDVRGLLVDLPLAYHVVNSVDDTSKSSARQDSSNPRICLTVHSHARLTLATFLNVP
jgi:hypothetical protein